MSNKIAKKPTKRPYAQKERAKLREQVHLRITKAAVELHGSVGPARTTMGEIARIAGVRRATVYNHFPTDFDLIDACSSHWFGENPPPDFPIWSKIVDPELRAETALGELYKYYDSGKHMLENVLRDSSSVTALEEILKLKWAPMLEAMIEILSVGRKSPKVELRASLSVALDFFTWQKLVGSGLSNKKAAALASGWIGR